MTPLRIQRLIAAVFLVLGGWCLLAPPWWPISA